MKQYIQIGTGGFGRYWCKTVSTRLGDAAVPVAAADISPAALENAKEFLGLPDEKCYTDPRRALAENKADFAVIIVPPQFHEEMIMLCLEYGLDIVCEKPLSDTMEACVRIYRAVKAAGRKLSVTMSHRLEVEKQTVEALVKSGAYGPANYAVSRLTMLRKDGADDNALRSPELMITGGLIHNLDTLRGVFGCNAKTVYADCWNFEPQPRSYGSCGAVHVVFENGQRGLFEESFANATTLNGWSREYLRVECAEATVTADNLNVTVQSHRGFPYPVCAQMPAVDQPHFDHSLVIHDFIDWIDGGSAPATCIDDNLQCCALVFAALKSARTGLPVDVQELYKSYTEA